MFSEMLYELLGKRITIQFADGDSSLVFHDAILEKIDKNVIKIRLDKGSDKLLYFNVSDIAMIGVGNFLPAKDAKKSTMDSFYR